MQRLAVRGRRAAAGLRRRPGRLGRRRLRRHRLAAGRRSSRSLVLLAIIGPLQRWRPVEPVVDRHAIREVVGALAAMYTAPTQPIALRFSSGTLWAATSRCARQRARAGGRRYPAGQSGRRVPGAASAQHDARAGGRPVGVPTVFLAPLAPQLARRKPRAFPNSYDFGDLRRFATLTATTEFFATRHAGFADLDSYLNGYAITGDALAQARLSVRRA